MLGTSPRALAGGGAHPARATAQPSSMRLHQFALFPWLRGQPGPAHNVAHLRIKGRLLARLHRDMASYGATEQRPGFGRIWELDLPLQSSRFATFNEMLREFGRDHTRLASAVRAQRYRSLRELARYGYGDLADVYIHGDFQRDNLLFDRGELAGVLDFDHAHRDARAVDIAWSIIMTAASLRPDGDRCLAAAIVAGYAETRRSRRIRPSSVDPRANVAIGAGARRYGVGRRERVTTPRTPGRHAPPTTRSAPPDRIAMRRARRRLCCLLFVVCCLVRRQQPLNSSLPAGGRGVSRRCVGVRSRSPYLVNSSSTARTSSTRGHSVAKALSRCHR
jgi:hypothetical protein